MIFWIGLIFIAGILPLIALFKLRNFWTLLLTVAPFLIYTFSKVSPECAANRASEACTWGYLNYSIALIAGLITYLIISTIQWAICALGAKKTDPDNFD